MIKIRKKTFLIVKKILTERQEKPHELLPDNFAREEIVQLGSWLINQKRFDDVIWLIDKFLDDPDPGEPENYRGIPEPNYHEQIVKGEHPQVITTVLGHLAQVIKELASHQEYIARALSYTSKLLSHKNLYVKLMAIIPLIEIAKRREWLEGYGKRPYEGKYKEFHDLVFDLVTLVKNNPNYKAIANSLCSVFVYYTDLSTEEVLDSLKISVESAKLFVYFGIFRQRQYKDQPIEFNGEKLEKKKLREVIKSENYQKLRHGVAWYLWKECRNEFNTLKTYVDLFLEQPYQKDVYWDIELIIRDCIRDEPDVCIQWYELMLSRISEFMDQIKQPQSQGKPWLWSSEEIMKEVAIHNPDKWPEIMKKLVSLWKKGAFIGSPKSLFETFKLISDKKQRSRIKRKFQKLYNSMKKIDPKLEEVDWREIF